MMDRFEQRVNNIKILKKKKKKKLEYLNRTMDFFALYYSYYSTEIAINRTWNDD